MNLWPLMSFCPWKKCTPNNPIPEELDKEEERFVLGAQGNVWTEYENRKAGRIYDPSRNDSLVRSVLVPTEN
ncbi:hypothetical protein C7972_1299 [Arenibacter sp. ARW7G5Y1]|nr:hypothetical protein C7972_1299 [Arenibacter sp. ARW7G5Y1]